VDLALVDPSKPWRARIEVDGQQIWRRKTDLLLGPPQLGSGGGITLWEPFYLTPEDPAAHVSGFDVDLGSMQFRVPVAVEATLGVSGRAYGYIATVGTGLAGALGTGWLWQLIAVFRSRKEKRSTPQ
jgi:hypothetical protein